MHINEQRSYTDILRAMQKVLMYMLRILRSQGIPATLLKDVFRATVLAKLIYTVNHKKGGSTFLSITLENLGGF